MKKYNFDLKDGTTKQMEFDELVRWACLIEAEPLKKFKIGEFCPQKL